MKSKIIHRRTFLHGAGSALIALPLLEAMGNAQAPAPAPQRFVVFFTANGTIINNWKPTGTGKNFSFSVNGDAQAKHVLVPLEAHKSRLLILEGVSQMVRGFGPGDNPHDQGMGQMLSCMPLIDGGQHLFDSHLSNGSSGGITIDQEMASLIGVSTRFRSFELGVESILDPVRELTSRMCYRKANEPIPPENNPLSAFKTLFAGVTSSGQPMTTGIDSVHLRRKSVLDKVQRDLTVLIPQVSQGDKVRLEAHLTAIRELETSLVPATGSTPVTCSIPTTGPSGVGDFATVGQQQMDLMALALACDLTRVISLQWSTAQSSTRHTWLGQSGEHHQISHEASASNPGARQEMVDIHAWYSGRFAYLLDKLAAIDEAGKSALDNSVVMWTQEQGDAESHSPNDIPYVLAGSAGGKVKTGEVMAFPPRGSLTPDGGSGVSHGDLYLALLHALGGTHTVFGLPDVSAGPLPILV